MTPFNKDRFLRDYWQQKPCVIRRFYSNFDDFLDEHELAGLATEPELDSRIVRLLNDSWQVIQGPFSDFSQCEGKWSLLVQGVDRHVPEAAAMMNDFNFVPYWRMDDLMISYAVAGAGVGPHVDQYDVFLVQGKGSRRWRVGSPDNNHEQQIAPDLRQVAPFEPVIDCNLSPGDILYIPPGWPHDGIAITPCITYSVGCRAPETAQLSGFLAEHLVENPANTHRFNDPARTCQNSPVWVTNDDIRNLKQLIHNGIESEAFSLSLLTALSEQTIEPEPLAVDMTADQVLLEFEKHNVLSKIAGLRPLMNPSVSNVIFVNGERLLHECEDSDTLAQLLSKDVIRLADIVNHRDKLDIISALTTLLNAGYCYFLND